MGYPREPAPVRRAVPRLTELDPYHPLTQEGLTTYPEFSAGRLFAECRPPATLGYSRLLHAEFVTRQTALTVMLELERVFHAFGRVPVERPVGYARRNVLYGRSFLGEADLADQCAVWLLEVANQRIHGAAKAVPWIQMPLS